MPHIRDTFENDTKMFQMFGFKDRYLANGAGNVPSQSVIRRAQETLAGIPNVAADEKLRGHLEPRLTLDLMALERLEDDIRAFNAKGQPFVAAFMPQMGHGPWFDLVGTTDVTKRGEAIVRLQLKWLEGLVEQLRASGALAKTVIVLTADHGVRTTQEDPSFIPSTLSDYSFEVPFLIFAPNALHGTKIISAPTSHVDIGPTLLTLLSVEHSRWPMQGTVIWNPHLHDRLLYFFATDYYGSDGTCSKGQFVSCSVMTEECRRNNRFEFPPPRQAFRPQRLKTLRTSSVTQAHCKNVSPSFCPTMPSVPGKNSSATQTAKRSSASPYSSAFPIAHNSSIPCSGHHPRVTPEDQRRGNDQKRNRRDMIPVLALKNRVNAKEIEKRKEQAVQFRRPQNRLPVPNSREQHKHPDDQPPQNGENLPR
jgi:Sulfatase